MSIDQDRRPGRFPLTGPANILAQFPATADSLVKADGGAHPDAPVSGRTAGPSDFCSVPRAELVCFTPPVYPVVMDAKNELHAGAIATYWQGHPEMRLRPSVTRRQV